MYDKGTKDRYICSYTTIVARKGSVTLLLRVIDRIFRSVTHQQTPLSLQRREKKEKEKKNLSTPPGLVERSNHAGTPDSLNQITLL